MVFVVCCVCSYLSNRLITRSEEFYMVCVCVCVCVCLIMCYLETTTMRWTRTELGCYATENTCTYCELFLDKVWIPSLTALYCAE
jgi:surface polysaccharide O-acyltransferase-like enzyme